MQKKAEFSAPTVDRAIEKALAQLGLDRDSVSVEVLSIGKKGFLGIGASDAKISVTYEVPDEVQQIRENRPAAEEKPAEKKAEKTEESSEAKEEKKEIRTLEKPEVTMIPADQLDPESPAGVAKEFLGELTRLMGVDVTLNMGTDAEGNVYGYIEGDTLGILIGRRGETLDAVQ